MEYTYTKITRWNGDPIIPSVSQKKEQAGRQATATIATAPLSCHPVQQITNSKKISTAIKEYSIWVNLSYEKTEDGKTLMIPKCPISGKEFSDDTLPQDFEFVKRNVEYGYSDGIGITIDEFFYGGDYCVCAITIENCDLQSEYTKDIIGLMKTYTEHNPSDKGYLLVFIANIAKLPRSFKERYYHGFRSHSHINCFIGKITQYVFEYTGKVIENGMGLEIRTEEFLLFLEKYMKIQSQPDSKASGSGNNIVTTVESYSHIIEKARKAKNGILFQALFDRGDTAQCNNNRDNADIALCKILAFWGGGNHKFIDEIYRKSALYREKWENEDYREATIKKRH